MSGDNKISWYIINASGKRVGRLASKVAHILQGKHKPQYTPHMLDGDSIIIINAEKVVFTGKKVEQKEYISHSGYMGGIKRRKVSKLLIEKPERILQHAIKGMLPKSKLARRMMAKVRIYAGEDHPHTAQKPSELAV